MILLTAVIVLLIALILLLGALLVLPIEFGLEIIKTADKNDLLLHFKILGIPIKIHLKANNSSSGKLVQKKEKSNFSFEIFKNRITAFKEMFDEIKDDLYKMLAFARKHLTIKKVDFNIHFGFDNAATTGISTGVIWGLGSFLLKVFDSLVGIKKINMQVTPDFNNKIFNIYLKTILIIKPIHLIIVVREVLKTYKFVNNKINKIKGGA